jgi:two-component system, LytTR family, sensor kinase
VNTSATYHLPITKPWVYHSLFWLSYYAFGALISLTIHQINDPRFYAQLLGMLPPDMLLVYGNLYLLLPHLLLKRKFLLYGLLLLICMSIIAALNIFLHHLYGLAGSPVFASTGEFNTRNFASQLLNSIYLLGLATALKFLKDWMSQRQELQEKERQQVALELNFLKSQVHPHFFFNTLNNLYSLTLQKSDLAPEVVLKLSDLMSYMLYDSGAALVPLDKEVVNLDNYIALEKLRFGSRLSLSFEKEGLYFSGPDERERPAEAVRIPPLILLTFVENSFKHGMNQIIGEGRITILLKVLPGELWFDIGNSVGAGATTAGGTTGPKNGGIGPENGIGMKNGIGLRNVVRRLDLLYGSRYRLDMCGTEDSFHVTLKIPLS